MVMTLKERALRLSAQMILEKTADLRQAALIGRSPRNLEAYEELADELERIAGVLNKKAVGK